MDQAQFLENFYRNLSTQFLSEDIHNLKNYSNSLRKLCTLKSQQTFLIRCRRKGIFPKNILNGTPIFKRLIENSHYGYGKILKTQSRIHTKILNLEISICIESIEKILTKLAILKQKIELNFPSDITTNFFQKQQ